MLSISQRIAEELSVNEKQVIAAVELLDEGSTVPFISRYRKEVTGGLDDSQLRMLDDRLRYLRELDDRREAILKNIDEQEKLTPELKASIMQADTKNRLEDLYLPYKQKRRTKAQIARESGLKPLAITLFEDPSLQPETEAEKYIDEEKAVPDIKAALDGARQILMEQFAEEADLLQNLREYLWQQGIIESSVIAGKEIEGAKFSDYFEYEEAVEKIPSHRALALFRGRNESILQMNLKVPNEDELDTHPCEAKITNYFNIENQGRAADKWLQDTVRWAWKIKIFSHLDVELKMKLKEAAEEEAIKVFASNLNDLLLAAPAGPKATLGLDPGLRTGVKVAVVNETGKLVDYATIYPHVPKNQWDQSVATLAALCKKHNVKLISIGNGTASRETDKLAKELISKYPELKMTALVVSEAGASVYSASELASKEFPDIDVSIRGAVSIARRLQDPLAELVKIEPKAIGVGQYQHDVSQVRLARQLDAVIEDCVNAVGVDINMASVPLLTQVSGLSVSMAENIVQFRDENGAFKNRKQLLNVPRLGPKAFEQSAGFLRISKGDNPLDSSSVHPEAYPLVEKIVEQSGKSINAIIGDTSFLKKLSANDFVDDNFGLPTVVDVIGEMEKPGRDPRPEFKTAEFKDGVEEIKDLTADMILEGVVTNVTNFGAFIDVGVHQDGLVHISALSNTFVKDPREVVKTGDVVKVKVMEVDVQRKRIALSMRLDDDSRDQVKDMSREKKRPQKSRPQNQSANSMGNSAMADALAQAFKK
ncbi:MAG: RNA-binding transcriptional accessory protein [endosymbiont of Galathealinum brachiosum]|uniref:RNA-binding transcriptional accessory protein n=1 Tax=endosymbiont of Galathealinum brachiosum TaxID=2200906 RepID=A0A370DD42_9GAMM|nr:MAG: RNA-binding transcriptional accessory protein [endosymbiont of Galathealinum brachiosum]